MKRILLPAGGAILATGLLAAGLATTAQADDDIAKADLAKTSAQAYETLKFWTQSNNAALKKAVAFNPDALEVQKISSGGGYSADTKPGSTAPIGEEKKSTAKVQNVNLPKTIGKVFFEYRDGSLYWCSGTSIQSQYRNLVATAGHCVYDIAGNDEVVSRWVFVPGYYQGKTPWGVYVGKQAFTHYDFDVYEDFDRDYAFVTVYDALVPGNPKATKVTQGEYKEHIAKGGKGFIKENPITEKEYLAGVDKYGTSGPYKSAPVDPKVETVAQPADGKTAADVEKYLKGEGTDKTIKAVKVEVTKATWTAAGGATAGSSYDNGAALKTDGPQPISKEEYERLTQEKADGKFLGELTTNEAKTAWFKEQFYVIKWVKTTAQTKYWVEDYYVVEGAFIKSGGRLGDNVGGQGFAWNQPTGKYVRTFGYPFGPHLDGNKPFTGVTPKWCYGKTAKNVLRIPSKKVEEQLSFKCTVTAGYDGAPWLYKYSNSKRLGYVNGVTSLIADTDNNKRYDTITSPYFDGETAAIYKAASASWSGKLVP